MKLYPNNIAQIIELVRNSKITSLLLYGPDKGMISNICKEIAKATAIPLNTIDQESLSSQVNNFSFFSDKQLLKVELQKTTLDEATKSIILSRNNANFVILIADELQTTHAIRKLFESEEALVIVACYPDDARSIKAIISTKAKESGKIVEASALEYLSQKLVGDRVLLLSEIEKLFTYAFYKKLVTLEDCVNIINDATQASGDQLCIYHGKNDPLYYNELEKLLTTNVSEVWILRALGRFYTNLLIVKMLGRDGMSIDVAMSKLQPPVFFRYVAPFKEVLSLLTLKEIKNRLVSSVELEIAFKNGVEVSCALRRAYQYN